MTEEKLSVEVAGWRDSEGGKWGRCVVCGEGLDRDFADAELHQGDEVLGDVCPRCLAPAPGKAADAMRRYAGLLEALAHRIEGIPHAEWPKTEAPERGVLAELCMPQWLNDHEGVSLALDKVPTESLGALAKALISTPVGDGVHDLSQLRF